MSEIHPDTMALLRKVSVATVCTQLFKRGFRNPYIQGIARLTKPSTGNLVGPAYTMRHIPAREDLDVMSTFENPNHPQRRTMEGVPPGHVLVIDCRRELRAASGGEILLTRLKVRGVAGIVQDGPVRDSGPISAMDFPVYCAGASAPISLVHHHTADFNVPIACGGVPVYPDDVIMGDDEGVVVIPRHLADEVAKEAAETELLEKYLLRCVEQGAALPGTYPPNQQVREAYAVWRKDNAL